jgi:hypothetical protein
VSHWDIDRYQQRQNCAWEADSCAAEQDRSVTAAQIRPVIELIAVRAGNGRSRARRTKPAERGGQRED